MLDYNPKENSRLKGLRFNKYLVYDTGATISVVNNKDILLNVKDATIEVSVADGATLEADCVGDLIIRVGIVSITLENTLYLPESSFNLVSLKQIEERGFNVLITKESVIVFNKMWLLLLLLQGRMLLIFIWVLNSVKNL